MSYRYETTNTVVIPIAPITITEWLRLSHTMDNTILEALIEDAFYKVEGICNSLFLPRTMELYTGDLIYRADNSYPYIQINKRPLTSVTSVSAMVDGVYTALDTDDYVVEKVSGFSRVYLTNTVTTDGDTAHPFKVNFTAGYTTIPADVKLAIFQYCAFLYENRGDVEADGGLVIPNELNSIVSKYRLVSVI